MLQDVTVSLATGDETTESACLAHLTGPFPPFARFLTCHLIPQPIALALALVEIDREANDVSEWNEERDDIAELGGMGTSPHRTTVGSVLQEQLLTLSHASC